MKTILAILLISVVCAMQPPVHPSPQASQDGKASFSETRGLDSAYDFSRHYAVFDVSHGAKPILHSDDHCRYGGKSQILFGNDDVGNCAIICIMLNSATADMNGQKIIRCANLHGASFPDRETQLLLCTATQIKQATPHFRYLS